MPNDEPIRLTLGHSPDPDDAFMWWPIVGKGPRAGAGRLEFRAVAADIEELNRRALEEGDLDITAMSARAWAGAAGRYVLSSAGSSFGDGYGPKVVCREQAALRCEGCLRPGRVRIAIPGRNTTAAMVLMLMLGEAAEPSRMVEMRFDRIIPAVRTGEVDAGLVIHEGQLTYADAGLREVVDLGAWWKRRTGLPLALGVNAIRRDLEDRHGAGTLREVNGVLRWSVRHALAHREEGLDHAMAFASADGGGASGRERIGRFVEMYVNRWSVDMGREGREAIRVLLEEGHSAGLCPRVERVEVVEDGGGAGGMVGGVGR